MQIKARICGPFLSQQNLPFIGDARSHHHPIPLSAEEATLPTAHQLRPTALRYQISIVFVIDKYDAEAITSEQEDTNEEDIKQGFKNIIHHIWPTQTLKKTPLVGGETHLFSIIA